MHNFSLGVLSNSQWGNNRGGTLESLRVRRPVLSPSRFSSRQSAGGFQNNTLNASLLNASLMNNSFNSTLNNSELHNPYSRREYEFLWHKK